MRNTRLKSTSKRRGSKHSVRAGREGTFFETVNEPYESDSKLMQNLTVDDTDHGSVLGARYRGFVPALRAVAR